MSRINRRDFLLITGVLGSLLPSRFLMAQSSKEPAQLTSDELGIYVAFLDSYTKLGRDSRPLIANSTATLACDKSSCDGFLMGSCNGLRTEGETPSEGMRIVKRDLDKLQPGTIDSFLKLNQNCVPIHDKIPASVRYYLFSDPEIPKDWKYTFLVYFSRVGFNTERTQALIYVGLASSSDARDSGGNCFLFSKVGEKWLLGGISAVWALAS